MRGAISFVSLVCGGLLLCANAAHADMRVFPASGVPTNGLVFIDANPDGVNCSEWIHDILPRFDIKATAPDEPPISGTLDYRNGDDWIWQPGAIMSPNTTYTLVIVDPAADGCEDFKGVGEQHEFRTTSGPADDSGLDGVTLSVGAGECSADGGVNFEVSMSSGDPYLDPADQGPVETGETFNVGLTEIGECENVQIQHVITGRTVTREVCVPNTGDGQDSVEYCTEDEDETTCSSGSPGGALGLALALLVLVARRRPRAAAPQG